MTSKFQQLNTYQVTPSASAGSPGSANLWRRTNAITTIASSSQGVAWDGTYYYVIDNTNIYKYDTSGTLISQHSTSSDGTYGTHIGDAFYRDGTLYVTASNYPGVPRYGTVMRYNPDTLAFISETNLAAGTYDSAIVYGKGWWWTASDANKDIHRYDENFVLQETTSLPEPDMTGAAHSWNGMAWVGDMLYLNPHADVYPQTMSGYHYDGQSFSYVGEFMRPRDCTQGMFWNEATQRLVFALRASSGSDGVIETKLESTTYWNQVTYYYYPSQITTSSTAYIEDGNLSCNINVRIGDIIQVTMEGIFWNTGAGNIRAYVDPTPDTAGRVTLMKDAHSIRSQNTNTDGTSDTTIKLYRADANGYVTFVRWWKTSSGTANVSNASITCRIIGYDIA